MRQTSIFAYHSLSQVTISKRQREVLDALRNIAPATNRMICEESGIPINVVTPRCNELVKKGMVVEAYTAIDQYGRKAIFWRPARTDNKEYDSGD